jgi:hypothetical protein
MHVKRRFHDGVSEVHETTDIQLLACLSSRAVVGWGKHSIRLDEKTRAHREAR